MRVFQKLNLLFQVFFLILIFSLVNSNTFSLIDKFLELIILQIMKVLRSIKSAKLRHRDCRVVKRKGRLYVINKTDARFKARQG